MKVSSRDTSLDAISIELLTGEWWEEEFEYLAYVEAAKAANGNSRGLIGGFVQGSTQVYFTRSRDRKFKNVLSPVVVML